MIVLYISSVRGGCVRVVLATVLLLGGCRKVVDAPTDVDGVMHDWWTGYDDDDAARASAAINAHSVTGMATIEPPVDGKVTDLVSADLALVGMDDRDPSLGTGMFLLNRFPCTLDALAPILVALNQDELYDGAYDSYERTYTSDADAWSRRDAPRLTWDIALTSSYIGSTFDETLKGEIRRIPDLGDDASPFGEILIQRTWMPEPAVFESGNKSFPQDYQIEVYYEMEPGTIAHYYGIWRQIDMGGGLDNNSDAVIGIILNNLADFDDGTAEICAAGGP
jgi:hypothetical protein